MREGVAVSTGASMLLRLSLIAVAVILAAAPAGAQEKAKTLLFFDIQITEGLPALEAFRRALTNEMAQELSALPGLKVVDASVRDAALMNEGELEKLGSTCLLTMRVKSLKTGTILSSQAAESACGMDAVVENIRRTSAQMWPPR